MRHIIQRAGHEFLPFLLTLVGIGTAVLFYLGNVYQDSPPALLVVLTLVLLAVCTEWLTFTFNQDMQDSITYGIGRGFAVLKALITTAVSVFIFASASIGLWAPRGGGNTVLWGWLLGIGVFAAQFLLKLTPERPRSPHSLANVALVVEQWAPNEPPEEQAEIAANVFKAIARRKIAQPPPAVLPAPETLELPAVRVESEGLNGKKPF